MAAGFSVLVNFPDGRTEIILVFDSPVIGSWIVDRAGKAWPVSDSSVREDDIDGKQIQFEVSVVEPEEPPNELL